MQITSYANDHLAMLASKLANIKSGTILRRLGMTNSRDLRDTVVLRCRVTASMHDARANSG